MGEAAAAAAAADGLMHRRIEFHAATKPPPAAAAAAAVPGGFWVERLFTDAADKRVAAAAAARSEGQGRRSEKGESSGSGFDQELRAARMYLRRIGAGLHNLGNTCYLNSVLQCLTYTEPFVAYLQSGKHKSSCRTAGFCALCALQNHVRCALQSTGKILTPMHFVKNLRCISRSFCSYRQEDAHELMVNLLESMHKCCLPSGIPSDAPGAYESSLVHRIFGGRLKSQVRCTKCSHCSNKYDPFLDLSLEIGNAATLTEAFHNFTEEELLDGGEKHYNCQRCKQKVAAKKRFTIDKAPGVLTIHLKRFSPFNPLQKIHKKVDFQPTLNLKPFVSNAEGTDLKYSLYGVLVHAGWNTQTGHYYCFVRTSSGIWHNLNDNQVHQVREGDVLRQKAYMLFYVRDRIRGSMMHNDNSAANFSEKTVITKRNTCMDGAIRNGLVETALNVFSSFTNENRKLWKQNPDNGQPSNSDSAQKAPCTHPDGAGSTKTMQISSDSQKQTTSPGQPGLCIIRDSSCDQKACEEPPKELQLKSDGSLTNSSKDIPPVFPVFNGADRLSGAKDQASEPRTEPFCNQIPDIETTTIAQIILTKDTAVSNGTVSSNEDSTSCNEAKEIEPVKQHDELVEVKELIVKNIGDKQNAEPVKQHDELVEVKELSVKNSGDGQNEEPVKQNDELVVVKELSAKNIDAEQNEEPFKQYDEQVVVEELSARNIDKQNAEPVKQHADLPVVKDLYVKSIDDKEIFEQISVPNAVEDEQVLMDELSVMDTNHVTDTKEQVNSENKICLQDSAQVVRSEDCAQAMCPEDSVRMLDKDPCHDNLHKNLEIKSKKHVKHPVANLFFGSKQLLLASLKQRKERKRKRTKMLSTSCMNIESIGNDQQTSTSETVVTKGTQCKPNRRKRSRNTVSSEDGVQSKKQNLGDCISAADLTMEKKHSKEETLASPELASSYPSSAANPDSGKCELVNYKGSWSFDLLTRGLREITVQRWDDNDMPNTMARELQCSSSTSIGYVLDEWDEENDRGRRKKVKKSIKDFSGPNPFQKTANMRSQLRMRVKANRGRSGNQPFRI